MAVLAVVSTVRDPAREDDRVTALRHLVHLLRGTWFRRLFAVRITSQLTDGVFQVALASYVVFSPERAPGPAGRRSPRRRAP